MDKISIQGPGHPAGMTAAPPAALLSAPPIVHAHFALGEVVRQDHLCALCVRIRADAVEGRRVDVEQ